MTELLDELRRRDIRLWREGDNLRFSAPAGALSPELKSQLAAHKTELLAQLSDVAAARTVIPRADRNGSIPLSFAQERLWVVDRLDPNSSAYNVPHCWRVTGPLDLVALERSLCEIQRRHEILRTTFSTAENGTPVQVIHSPSTFSIRTISADPHALARIAAEEAATPFDIAAGPLWRATVAKLGDEDYALLFTWHHTIFDAWSCAIFIRELAAFHAAFHAGQPNPLLDPALQYADFACWQRERFASPAMDSHLAFWRERLRGERAPIPVPADRPRPARQSHHGGMRVRDFSSGLAAKVRNLAREEGVTLFVLSLAAFKALLVRFSGETDICIGSPIAQRPNVETEGMIGCFLNMLALRSDLSGDPDFREVLRRVRATVLGAFQHQDVPFEKIVEDLHPSRDPSHQPLFQIAFVLQPAGENKPAFAGATVQPLAATVTTAKFDLTLFIEETPAGMRAMMEYSSDLFDGATVDRMLESLELLLEGAAADPATPLSRLPILSETQRERILTEWSGSERPFPDHQTVAARFAECAAKTPSAIAVSDGDEHLTYAQLDARANRVAHFLQSSGMRAGDFVGLRAERSVAFVVNVLGIVKAGAAYVPFDEREPAARLSAMKRACALILDSEPDEDAHAEPVASDARADGPAYVLFTSGSTGVPKGVIVPHRAIMRLVVNSDYAPLQPDDVVAFASNVCFDAATFEIWGALLNGATLVVVPQDILLSTSAFATFIPERGITALFLTTALFNQIALQNPVAFRPLKHLLFGGEACNPDCVRRVLEHGAPQRLVHVYGPTEATTFASWHLVTRTLLSAVSPLGGQDCPPYVPIGLPIANTTIHILDSRLQIVPCGVVGEIFIGGPGLAIGYLNNPALTVERFIQTPFGRLYKTGDLARRRADGAIEFRGRVDSQVKLRGFRIEPGEIEAAFDEHPGVLQSAVVAQQGEDGAVLNAYLIPRSEQRIESTALRDFLSHRLPAHMIPSNFIWLDSLPLTANGKLNHRMLPPPAFEASTAPLLPRNSVENALAEIWSDVLHRTGFSIRDDFFTLGGHSLLALRMLGEVRKKFGVEVLARRLFEMPTIEGIAQFISERAPALARVGETLTPLDPDERARAQTGDGRIPVAVERTHAPARIGETTTLLDDEKCFQSLMPIQRGESARTPLFLVAGGWGGEIEFLVYAELSRHMDSRLPIWGLKARGAGTGDAPHTSVSEMAADYLREIRELQPTGPYIIAGECVGGVCAYEIACQLEAAGEEVALLMLFDTTVPASARVQEYVRSESRKRAAEFWEVRVRQRVRHHLGKMAGLSWRGKIGYLFKKATGCGRPEAIDAAPSVEQYPRGQKDYPVTLMSHRLKPYGGKVTLLLDEESSRLHGKFGWASAPIGELETHVLPGDHISYIREHAKTAAAKIQELLLSTSAPLRHDHAIA